MIESMIVTVIVGVLVIAIGVFAMIVKCFHQVTQGTALIRNGFGGPVVAFSGITVVPVFHKIELMDLSVKRIEIYRHGKEGLVCRDNLRADVKLAFFIRVNNKEEDVLRVAQSLGCRQASDIQALVELFDAKFSEALKTVGKQFDFIDLYTKRKEFKEEIIHIIGKDLNGYVLEDAAIDYLEQTPLELLNPNNILDCEGIKKITSLTSAQAMLSNQINRQKEMTIVQQDVKAKEAVLELQRQQAEAEQKQFREVAAITAREQAEAKKIEQEERLKGERARITADEEIAVAEENKNRQVVVAKKNRERTEAVETERVERDRKLEATEREKVVALAEIAKTRVVETETKDIQEVIRQRVSVQKAVAEEEERIKDIREYAAADRQKKVCITQAEMGAEQALVTEIKKAEAAKKAAVFQAEQVGIQKEAERQAAEKVAASKKLLASGIEAEIAAPGLGEAKVMETKAAALEKQGIFEANVLEKKALAEAKGIEAKAAALEKQGMVEAAILEKKAIAEAKGLEAKAEAIKKQGTIDAEILGLKFSSEAHGIQEKANAMKVLDAVGRGHEEFKLRLAKDRDIELAEIAIQKDIAMARAEIVGQALKSAHIDIVGGETAFFEKIVGAVSFGKSIDRMVDSSKSLTAVKDTFLTGDPKVFQQRLQKVVSQFGVSAEDLKNFSISALLVHLINTSSDDGSHTLLNSLLDTAKKLGFGNKSVGGFLTSNLEPQAEKTK